MPATTPRVALPVRRAATQCVVLQVLATAASIVGGRDAGLQILGLIGALLATLGAAWYTTGGRFPGALSRGGPGGVAGLLGAGFAVTLITGFWAAVQQRLSPERWDAMHVIEVLLYIATFLVACTLAFWCITAVVERDRSRKS